MSAHATAAERVCPLLERATATRVLDIAPPPWRALECLETGFVFLANPPGYDSLKSEFAWEQTWQRESARRARAEPARYAVSALLKRLRARVLKRNRMASLAAGLVSRSEAGVIRIVDLGCGWGELLGRVMDRLPPALKSRCEPWGVEISNELARQSSAAFAANGGQCIHASALDGLAQFAPASLDLIVMASFLEHETQPLPLLRHSRDALRAGGRVLIKVPNHASWNRFLRGPRWCGYRWPDHVNYFTPSTLTAIARRAGLEVERMNRFDRLPFSDSLYAVLRKPPA